MGFKNTDGYDNYDLSEPVVLNTNACSTQFSLLLGTQQTSTADWDSDSEVS